MWTFPDRYWHSHAPASVPDLIGALGTHCAPSHATNTELLYNKSNWTIQVHFMTDPHYRLYSICFELQICNRTPHRIYRYAWCVVCHTNNSTQCWIMADAPCIVQKIYYKSKFMSHSQVNQIEEQQWKAIVDCDNNTLHFCILRVCIVLYNEWHKQTI